MSPDGSTTMKQSFKTRKAPGLPRRAPVILAVSLVALTLGACAKVDRVATMSSTVPDTVAERHPIILSDTPYTLDLFPATSMGDKTQNLRIRQFADTYREVGRGQITIMLPQGGAYQGRNASAVNVIRQNLAAAGVTGNLRVTHYAPENANLASPVRLTFVGLKAKTATRCGEWPDDLGSGGTVDTWQNKEYWNYGCSYQNMIAAQVADPRDLASPRGETPADVNMRMRAIGNVRKGVDPSTKWDVRNTNIGGVGG